MDLLKGFAFPNWRMYDSPTLPTRARQLYEHGRMHGMNTLSKLHEASMFIAVTEKIAEKVHEIAETRHVTFGDMAKIAAEAIPAAVDALGIADHTYHPHKPPVTDRRRRADK